MAERIMMKGNEAVAEGAVRAGCRFFAGYPITPQNEIPEYLSWRMSEVGGTFIQAESEVAAINMLYGASACGARVMTSSSGPGISLKQEGISYSAGAQLPIFYVNVERGGPGLGNIAPSQGDYFQATRGGGHGDYRVIVLAPCTVKEMANFPKLCYELGEKYRNPSMILTDGILGQMMEPLEFDFEPIDPNTFPPKDYTLGNAEKEGRERRVVRSYDLGSGGMEIYNFKLQAKFDQIEANEIRFEEYYLDGAEIVIVAYGSCARIAKSSVTMGRSQGVKIGLLRPITLWPFPMKEINQIASKVENILVAEMSLGQLIDDVKIAAEGKARIHLHPRPSGGIPTPEEILEKAKKILKS